MPEKLLTLRDLSSYLGISEEKITSLVEEGVISAYRIGGEFLRFRKDQVDAVFSEINARIKDGDRLPVSEVRAKVRMNVRSKVRERYRKAFDRSDDSLREKLADFFYFYDFYLVSVFLIAVLLIIMIKG